ncbi:MAG: hypothetical protein CMQ05_00210 [Gammaproteobacteria bacterium]|uniref:Carboxylic ester hydrolase n=1 Tax=OM182 bacterium MED-G24 TaxID=1986255 RepID=A0A2A5WM94_9GAMM|nr:hypothetical protein [Gammaproteobacteria bacterium]PDH37388.1 MAG: hypothetical protein CNE99_08240 [OM182 bacterium MED-G24]RPG23348.1 MAG: carboxylesterase/lipase family protein [Gammaproteobacteria bacterium TMED50]|tara:strand:+ start:1262 stop:2755 length:1494 start_codon:yes stop_codon:yes gene_type:complete
MVRTIELQTEGSRVATETRLGKIEGLPVDGGTAYLGIRFGEPPVGDLRFMPPIASGAWSGVYDATQWPNRAIQTKKLGTMDQDTPGDRDEDCLFLNVHTPAADSTGRPVMVWIHGGGLTGGSANEYDGRVLAREGDVVVVTINYRLGPFGFLNLEPLGYEFKGSASNGIRDIVLALEWVRDNIADFGGDPHNVTVFGESAGAKAILALSGTPTADGLYHKAIANSPAAAEVSVGDKTAKMAEQLGVEPSDLLATLRRLPAFALQDAGLPAGYEVDGEVITLPFMEALKEKGAFGVPMIIGTNRTEGTLFTPPDSPDEDMGRYEQSLAGSARGVIGNRDATEYVAGIKSAYPDHTPKQWMEIISSDHFRKTAVEVSEIASESGCWLYRFDLNATALFRGKLMQTAHACEMAFTFNTFADDDCCVMTMHDPDAPGVRDLARHWSATLTHFAHTGDPNGAGLPQWQAYDTKGRAVMLLDQESVVEQDPDKVHRELWGASS